LAEKFLHDATVSLCAQAQSESVRLDPMLSGGLFMSLIYNAVARLLAISALATLSLATVAEAQMNGQGEGGGGMMGNGWGWGMGYGTGGFGGIGVLLLGLVVLGIAVMAFRRRNP
jgi:hypothetical protein